MRMVVPTSRRNGEPSDTVIGTPHWPSTTERRRTSRHGISRLPEVTGDKPAKQPFKAYPIGYFHINIAEVRTEEGKLYLFVAVDRTSKYAFARLMQKATVATARAFLNDLVKAVPYKIHTVLTDNGIQFADLPKNRSGPTAMYETAGENVSFGRGEAQRAHIGAAA